MGRNILLCFLIGLCLAGIGHAQDQMNFPTEPRAWCINTDGSCVQCALSEIGIWQNCPQASTLLYNTQYGPAERGGSYPSRVEAYAQRRGIPLYNVTGSATYDMMKWAAKTGRMAAVGCFSAHFQTLLWYNPDPTDGKPWKIANNWVSNYDKNFAYTEEEFRAHHMASGQWVVILKTPPPVPANPVYVKWWEAN
jgi:hypothetical protein